MGDGFRTYAYKKKDAEAVARIQDAGVDLTANYLSEPLERVLKSKLYNDQEIASALIMFAYHLLRQQRSARQAEDAFNVQAHFAKLRIERGIQVTERKTASIN